MLSSYKGSPYSVLLSCQGSSPLARWKLQATTGRSVSDQLSHHIQRVYERDIKGYCIHLLSQSIKLEYDLETGVVHSSGSHHPYLVVQLYVPVESKKLTIEITTIDTLGSKKNTTKRHLFFSTANKELKTTPLHAAIPISSIVQRGEWFSLILDLPMYYQQLYPTSTYKSMEKIAFMGDRIRFRNIFTMKTHQAQEFPTQLEFPFHSSHSTWFMTGKGHPTHSLNHPHPNHPSFPSSSSSSSPSPSSSLQMQKMKILERVNFVSKSVDACDEEVHQIVSQFKEKQKKQQPQQSTYSHFTPLLPISTHPVQFSTEQTSSTPNLHPTSSRTSHSKSEIQRPSSSSSSSSSTSTTSTSTTSRNHKGSSRSLSRASLTSAPSNLNTHVLLSGIPKPKSEVSTCTPCVVLNMKEPYDQRHLSYMEEMRKKNTTKVKSNPPSCSSFSSLPTKIPSKPCSAMESTTSTSGFHYDSREREKENEDIEDQEDEHDEEEEEVNSNHGTSTKKGLSMNSIAAFQVDHTNEVLNVEQKEKVDELNNKPKQEGGADHTDNAAAATDDDDNDDDDDSVELIYSEVHQCYYDPLTGKFYQII